MTLDLPKLYIMFYCVMHKVKKLTGYLGLPNIHKCIELMSNDDTRTVCSLANFVFKAFLIR